MQRVSLDYRALLPERFEVDVSRRYVLDKLVLGQGGYGKVFVAKDSKFENRLVAVKKVTKTDDKSVANWQDEIEVMKDLDHPNICKLFETFEQGRHLFFVMEFCEGGELFTRIIEQGHISEEMSASVAEQVAAALRYAHDRSIAHRDIKPENLVFCTKEPLDFSVKLIDWGLSVSFAGEVMRTAVGSFAYAAPEVIMSRNVTSYSCACDLWSLGVVTYVMLCGKPPFWGSPQQHLKNARAEKYPMSAAPWDTISASAKDFVAKLLKSEPSDRATAADCLQHPWVAAKEGHQVDPECTKQVMQNLQQYRNHGLFMQLCIIAVARQLDYNHLKTIHQVFRDMDKNGDGTLSAEEISDGLKKMFGEDSKECGEIGATFATLDLDGSGAVDYTEFCAAGLGEHAATRADAVWAAFKAFDLDDNGKLSKAEIQKVLGNTDVQKAWTASVCEDAARDIFEGLDADGDGQISFEEWLQAMQSSWARNHPELKGVVQGADDRHALERLTAARVSDGTHMHQAYESLTQMNQLSPAAHG